MDKTVLRVFRLYPRVVLHLASPLQKTQDLVSFPPHEAAELGKADALHLNAGVGLDAPAEVGTPPRRQAVPARGTPKKAQDVAHD